MLGTLAKILFLLLLLSTPLHQRAASRVQHPNHVAANSLSPQVARKGSTLSGFVQRSRLEREVGRDLHSNKYIVSHRLDQFQRRVAFFVHHDYRRPTSVDNLIKILGLYHLHTRRLVSQNILYSMIYTIIQLTHIYHSLLPCHIFCIHDHEVKYAILHDTNNGSICCFYSHSLRRW